MDPTGKKLEEDKKTQEAQRAAERLREELHKGYQESLSQLEAQAKEGMKQRDEIIAALKTEKRSLKSEVDSKLKELSQLS